MYKKINMYKIIAWNKDTITYNFDFIRHQNSSIEKKAIVLYFSFSYAFKIFSLEIYFILHSDKFRPNHWYN